LQCPVGRVDDAPQRVASGVGNGRVLLLQELGVARPGPGEQPADIIKHHG